MHEENDENLKLGIFLIMLAWLNYSLMATISRFVSATVPVILINFFQNFIGCLAMIPVSFINGVPSVQVTRKSVVIIRAASGLLAFFCLFSAVKYTSLVDAVLLNNAGPLIVPFICFFWLKIPINHKLWPGIVVGFIGIIFILKPGQEILNIGALFGVGAAVSIAVAMTASRILSVIERHENVLFVYFMLASIVLSPIAFLFWQPLSGTEKLELLAIGLFFTFGQLCFIRAFRYGKPTQIAPFSYSGVLFSLIIQYVLWDQLPDLWAWIGIALVCAGGIWVVHYNKSPILTK